MNGTEKRAVFSTIAKMRADRALIRRLGNGSQIYASTDNTSGVRLLVDMPDILTNGDAGWLSLPGRPFARQGQQTLGAKCGDWQQSVRSDDTGSTVIIADHFGVCEYDAQSVTDPPEIGSGQAFCTISRESLLHALRACCRALKSDMMHRPGISGVVFDEIREADSMFGDLGPSDGVALVATDGARLHAVGLPATLAPGVTPGADSEGHNDVSKLQIPLVAARALVDVLAGATAEIVALSAEPPVFRGAGHLTASCGRWLVQLAGVYGDFPKWRSIVPNFDMKPERSAVIERVQTMSNLRRVVRWAGGGRRMIRASLRIDGRGLLVETSDRNGAKCTRREQIGPNVVSAESLSATFGADARLLIDALSASTADSVRAFIGDHPLDPIVIRAPDLFAIVMPARLD